MLGLVLGKDASWGGHWLWGYGGVVVVRGRLVVELAPLGVSAGFIFLSFKFFIILVIAVACW